jgi:hypothetical protein
MLKRRPHPLDLRLRNAETGGDGVPSHRRCPTSAAIRLASVAFNPNYGATTKAISSDAVGSPSTPAHFTQVDHAFRSKAITGFGSWRSAVSADVDHRR